jgi:diguanylate cyclase (GGDEF)-like protein
VQHLQRNDRDYLICVGRNNTHQLEAAARLEDLSNHDALTGLCNRRYFDGRIDSEWRRLTRHQGRLGLLMIDVDHFKPFNDTLGHQAGDDALRRLAETLSESLLREGDTVCRYGGEEFVVILPGADREQCGKVAEHLHQAVADLQIDHPASCKSTLSVSIGAASAQPSAATNHSELIEMADKALYQAKAAGRNQTQIASAASETTLR